MKNLFHRKSIKYILMIFEELVLDVKYTSASNFDVEGYTLLDHNKLSEVEKIK